MTSKNEIALRTALAAVLCEAKALGCDVEAIARKAKNGLVDSAKPYKWAGPECVVPASAAIDEALEVAKHV